MRAAPRQVHVLCILRRQRSPFAPRASRPMMDVIARVAAVLRRVVVEERHRDAQLGRPRRAPLRDVRSRAPVERGGAVIHHAGVLAPIAQRAEQDAVVVFAALMLRR